MSLKWLPNAISALRIALVAPILILIFNASFGAALVLFVIAAFSDGLDGYLARRNGWFTRLGALGMLTMTMVIQLFVFPDAWFTAHMFWATILFAVVVLGPGAISLDRLLFRR